MAPPRVIPTACNSKRSPSAFAARRYQTIHWPHLIKTHSSSSVRDARLGNPGPRPGLPLTGQAASCLLILSYLGPVLRWHWHWRWQPSRWAASVHPEIEIEIEGPMPAGAPPRTSDSPH